MVAERERPDDAREPDAGETKFIDQILEGWARWARNDSIDLRPTCAGDLWQIQAIIEASTYVMRLTDESFTFIDGRIAGLPERLRRVIIVEYCRPGTSEVKARKLGLNRLAYRQRLHAAQWTLFTALLPEIDNWRQKPL